VIDPPRQTPIDGYIARAPAEARVGRVLRGKWRLDALLGVGGMAAVYAATHRNGMRGAVKLLHPIHSRDGELRRRFLREGYLANRVEHIGAVRVLDDDTSEDGAVFLVMELLEGEALIDRAIDQGGTLPVHEVMWLGDQLLDALAAAHGRGVVHRDIKPDNLFLTHGGTLKILDFGLACVLEPIARPSSELLVGTPAYMPPEQVDGNWEQVDARSDIWSVGATLFALASGTHVYDDVARELGDVSIFDRNPSLMEAMPDAPEAFARVVDRALRADKADRWPDARAMQAALRLAHEQIFGAPIPPPGLFPNPGRRVSSPELHFSTVVTRPPSPRWITGIAGGGAIGVCIGLFALAAREPREAPLESAGRSASEIQTVGALAAHPATSQGWPTSAQGLPAAVPPPAPSFKPRAPTARSSATPAASSAPPPSAVAPSAPPTIKPPSRVSGHAHATPSEYSGAPASTPLDESAGDLYDRRY
jgi:serine/threonine-protein kinase